MTFFPNDPGYQPRVLLLGGTSEIGLAILSALSLPPDVEVILAGRDAQRLKVFADIVKLGRFFFTDAMTHDPDAVKKRLRKDGVAGMLAELDQVLSNPLRGLPTRRRHTAVLTQSSYANDRYDCGRRTSTT